eukprot:7583484-Prorocentrum_lima.AAC.1
MVGVLRGMNALTVPTNTNMVMESAGAGKPPPPVLGKSSGNPAPTNLGATGKAAPVFYNVANHPPPPPPPASNPPSMQAIGGKVCLRRASSSNEGLPLKSPPTDCPP